MPFQFTDAARRATEKVNIEPTYAFCIEGIDYCFTAVAIQKYIRWGDPELYFGDDWVYGGVRDLEDQKTYVSLDGSSKRISQQLYPDKGSTSSVSSVTVRLIDKNGEVSKIITPGLELVDILGTRADLWIGFRGTAYPDDYTKIFSGLISDIVSGAGWVELTVNHPDEKKRSRLFEKYETTLNGAIDSSTTTVVLEGVVGLIQPSDDLRSFVKVDDEFIEYTGLSGNTLTGVIRGSLSSEDPRAVAAAHDDDAAVESFYLLEGGAIALALKLMLSTSGDFATGVEIENFVLTENATNISNAIYFDSIKLNRDYGLVLGDFVTVTGAANGGNNVTSAEILDIVDLVDGSYIVVAGPLVLEADSAAVASFKSKYDVLPDGLKMDPRDVDVAQHEFINETFVAGLSYKFYLKDTIANGKEFIEKEIYVPFAGYALPRGTRSSLGIHIAPFPFSEIVTLSAVNIKNPSKIKLRRSYARNFYNSIVYRYDESLYDDKFESGTVSINQDSITETGRRRDLLINSKGLRTSLDAVNRSANSSLKLLDRYKRGAEFLEGVEVFFGDGMRLEPGDAVVFDASELQITNTADGSRVKGPKFFEVTNKNLDLSGRVTVTLTDTSFDGSARYALFSPASYITGGTTTQVTITASFSQPFGINEWRKWEDFVGASVRIRNTDFSVVGVAQIGSIAGNVITLTPALSFTPLSGYLMEFSKYDDQVSARVKLLYTHNSEDDNPFADGGDPYVYL